MISPTGVWSAEEAQHHQHSDNLARFLICYLDKSKPVYDFGAGLGFYVNELNKAGFNAIAIDGNKDANLLTDKFKQFDLSMPVTVDVKGNVICLEAGEHIPKQFEQILLDTLTNACHKQLILSWGLPNQAGLGHCNLQPQEYIIAEIERRCFKYLPDVTKQVRGNIEQNCNWFERTIMLFERI